MLFVGTDYKPNLDAIKWFLENVANKVKDKAILKVVGYKLEKYKDKFIKYSNIEIEGTVDDLSKYYRDADLVIAPIFSGGGMKIKTAEAFGYGKFFAGTDESLIGYWEMVPDALKNKKVFLCNTPKEYVELINSLYEIDFNKYNGDICSWMQEEYSFESNNRKYENIWKNIN
jgi:glycosyltransferase involved in cell wall biosynthesis